MERNKKSTQGKDIAIAFAATTLFLNFSVKSLSREDVQKYWGDVSVLSLPLIITIIFEQAFHLSYIWKHFFNNVSKEYYEIYYKNISMKRFWNILEIFRYFQNMYFWNIMQEYLENILLTSY